MIRRAIVRASAGQYLSILITLAATLVLARLLTPAEFGVAALGLAVLTIAEALREIGGGSYLIREPELSADKIQSSMTVSLIVTVVVASGLVLAAEPLAGFFAAPQLAPYLRVAALGYCLGPFIYPVQAVMSRELAFGALGVINVTLTLVGAVIGIVLAMAGFKAMSLAWGGVAAAVTGALLCLVARQGRSIYCPSLNHWRSVIGFGAYSGLTAILGRLGEVLPLLIFGKLLNMEALAIGQRAVLLCVLPERVILVTIGAAALPVLARQTREGEGLKHAYLGALARISAVQWPALILLTVLAGPIVALAFGRQWLEVIPLVQILAPAVMFSVPIGLQYPFLVAAGAVRGLPLLVAAQLVVTTAVLASTAGYGLEAAAMSMFVAVPVNALLSFVAVRRAIGFQWCELGSALHSSILVAILTAAGPLSFMISSGADLSEVATLTAVLLGAVGWVFGLFATGHPLWGELMGLRVAFAVPRSTTTDAKR